MPKPGKNESQKDFIGRCVPTLVSEGKKQKQAVAICYSLWRERKKEGDMEDKEGCEVYYPLGGATTFAELQETRTAQEAAWKVQDLTYDFQLMIDNIMKSDVEDKPAAIKSLTDEFLGLVDSLPKSKSLWDKVKELFSGKAKKEELKEEIKEQTNTFMVWKEATGYRWLTAYSNKFRDDDNPPEILSDAAHKEFVEAVDKGEWPYPELWLWHVKGSRSGAADYVAYDGSFALASGTFDADKQDVAEKLSRRDDLLTSHGMPVTEIQRDKEDQSILTRYRTLEISVLPDFAAANKHTPFTIVKEVDMALPELKRAFLVENLGEDKVTELEAKFEGKAKELEKTVEFKEEKKEETPIAEPEPVVKYATEDAVVDAIAGSLKPVLEQLESLRQSVENFGKELKQLEITEDEKIKNLITETPAASLFHRVQSAIGSKDTEIDGRSSLAKSGPKETPSNQEGPSSVPIINEYLSRRQ